MKAIDQAKVLGFLCLCITVFTLLFVCWQSDNNAVMAIKLAVYLVVCLTVLFKLLENEN